MARQIHVSIITIFVSVLSSFAQNPTAAPHPGAGPSEDSATEQLQKAVQNPVASLISVPLQNNANFVYGPRRQWVRFALSTEGEMTIITWKEGL